MGLADRDYIRNPPRRGRGFMSADAGRPVYLSATLWLIIINCAVFALDRMVLSSGRAVDAVLVEQVQPQYADRARELVPVKDILQSSRYKLGLFERPLVDPQTNEIAGVQLIAKKPPLEAMGFFSTLKIAQIEVWRLITFQFVHANFYHLATNMIGLFFFGPVAERYLGSRRLFLAFYLMCGIAGASLYLLLNVIGWLLPMDLPLVLANEPWVPLVGASAGVFGVLWAASFIDGASTLYLFGIIPLKTRVGVYLFTGIAFFNLLVGGTNAGGDAAHIGGAIAGAYFIRHPHLLLDFFDEFLRTSDRHPRFHRAKGRARARKPAARTPAPAQNGRRLDAILEKIKREGEGALTPAERTFLDRETRRRRRGGR